MMIESASLLLELPVAHLLKQGEQGLGLLGSQCRACGEVYFPAAGNCTACCGSDLAPCDIGSQGRLWSWTVQAFMPKAPFNSGEAESDFQPYGVGYVEMPSGVKVESRLTTADPAVLSIGMPMTLCLVRYGQRADGRPLHTFAFAPATEGDK
jgi:uncharacterized OB-fold protein